MGSRFQEAQAVLDAANEDVKLRTGRSEALCFYSGGKESRVVAALAKRSFQRVVGVFMYLVPGLECVEEALAYGTRMLKASLHRPTLAPELAAAIPKDMAIGDVYDLAIEDSGIPMILTGAKAADSMWRRRSLKAVQYREVKHPIETWTLADVRNFLAANNIPVPSSSGRSATGIDLTEPSLLWLHDTFPRDFERLLEFFPFASAVLSRRRLYGIPPA